MTEELMVDATGHASVFGEKNGSKELPRIHAWKNAMVDRLATGCETMIVPHSRPTMNKEDLRAVTEVLASGMIAQGEKVKEFENAIVRHVGMKYAIAVSSGTSALHLALLGLGVSPGNEVVMPSYVCPSPYFAAMHSGAVPKIVDIASQDLNICAATAKDAVSSRTKAIVVPHMFGNPAELDALLDLEVPLIEDCAQSLGAKYQEREVGSFGSISVFSFYATKVITTGEGGMVLTSDRDRYEKLVELRDYDKKALHPTKYNYKMTDFQAALGLSQLARLQDFIERRLWIAQVYDEAFAKFGVTLPRRSEKKAPIYYRYVVLVDRLLQVRKKLKKLGIICERPVLVPLHREANACPCRNTDRAFAHALSIPLYPSLTDEEVQFVAKTVSKVFREFH